MVGLVKCSGSMDSVSSRADMHHILKQVMRSAAVGLAIPGAVFVVLVLATVVPSCYHAWGDDIKCRTSPS